jgi:hypothetical protein
VEVNNVLRLFPEPTPVAEPSRFEELWKVWPRREGKALARAKFDGIVRGAFQTRTLDKSAGEYMPMSLTATADEIIAGAKAYVQSQIDTRTYRLKDDGKFVPHLSTWLGRAGWEDFT